MRYIGNKTKLLGEIEAVLTSRGIARGTFIDIFAGTASVSRYFKGLGFRVIANDILSASYTQAVAAVEVSRPPAFARLLHAHRRLVASRTFRAGLVEREEDSDGTRGRARGAKRGRNGPSPVDIVVHLLNHHVEPREGLIFRAYCPGGRRGRRYFRDEHGRAIDGILEFLRRERGAGNLEHGELHLLLAALLAAADRRANISGTYGAYLKEWQPNTCGDLVLEVPVVAESRVRGHRVFREDSNLLLPRLRGDVLYIDPPYNRRQYGANYHVLEVMAEHHRIDDLETYERSLYGKTGLRPYGDVYSDYCVPVGGRARRPRGDVSGRPVGDVGAALEHLVLSARVRHLVLSYNEEGLLDRDQIGAILARFEGVKRYDFRRNFTEVHYRRFRSDRDREDGDESGGRRRYRVLEGKGRDEIAEWLFFATRG
jgi:adenine-specific DNA-methyltransferase